MAVQLLPYLLLLPLLLLAIPLAFFALSRGKDTRRQLRLLPPGIHRVDFPRLDCRPVRLRLRSRPIPIHTTAASAYITVGRSPRPCVRPLSLLLSQVPTQQWKSHHKVKVGDLGTFRRRRASSPMAPISMAAGHTPPGSRRCGCTYSPIFLQLPRIQIQK